MPTAEEREAEELKDLPSGKRSRTEAKEEDVGMEEVEEQQGKDIHKMILWMHLTMMQMSLKILILSR